MVRGVESAELEALTDDQLFNIDVLASTSTGQKLAVEFDGPHHYAITVPASATTASSFVEDAETVAGGCATSGDGQSQQVLKHPKGRPAVAPTFVKRPEQHQQEPQLKPQLVPVRRVLFRNRMLSARGLRVVCVPYFEWAQHQSKAQRRLYLQRRLFDALQTSAW
jgi:hypothetical protein